MIYSIEKKKKKKKKKTHNFTFSFYLIKSNDILLFT